MLATPVSRLLALPTAAVLTNGSDTPVSVNQVSERREDVGFVDVDEDSVIK